MMLQWAYTRYTLQNQYDEIRNDTRNMIRSNTQAARPSVHHRLSIADFFHHRITDTGDIISNPIILQDR